MKKLLVDSIMGEPPEDFRKTKDNYYSKKYNTGYEGSETPEQFYSRTAEIPKDIKIGDKVYGYSVSAHVWFLGEVAKIRSGDCAFSIGIISQEYNRGLPYYTHKIRYNIDDEISLSREDMALFNY